MTSKIITTVKVALESTYPIYIGKALLADPSLWQAVLKTKRVLVVTNATVAQYHLAPLSKGLAQFEYDVVKLPEGEQHKNLKTWQIILNKLVEKNYHRDSTVIAFGGGVVGDISGFAASCYQRGVPFLQVPTTLLAQVDSSIGGKTGINFQGNKNFIGSFYQPQAVVMDLDTLNTLPRREFSAGLAEIIKAAMLADAHFFIWLQKNIAAMLVHEANSLAHAIATSCRIKATIVVQDEKEHGPRALLNLGHTFAHAIESTTDFQQYLHGEAVAIGLVMAAHLSQMLGLINEVAVKQIQTLLKAADLPITLNKTVDPQQLLKAMSKDKKIVGNKLRLIVLEKIGKAVILEDINPALVLQAITACLV